MVDSRHAERQARADRLKQARAESPYAEKTAQEMQEITGINRFTFAQHENGTRGFKEHAERYADLYKVRLDWLWRERGPMKEPSGGKTKVAVAGYVGAGAEVFSEDPYPRGRGLKMVEPPIGLGTDIVALMIRGDSMHPFKDGWLIFYRRNQEGVPDECYNQLCVVRTEDGKTLCKELYKGTQAKRFNLVSWNAPPRENVKLEWAAKVIDIRTT